ncbi:class I SAM-dependent methyltransferase [Corynebacterium pseudodiphtheriticum]|uniref:class I SAM-dependent methyltransferase n=1 Tax=Corynebacterium TaxID=1716 RepID=UPI0011C719B5|nr:MULTISPECIES: class I SAM-dependent methyltransferase [Corynebacterium]MDK4243408.1 class I SAM-dependent methyltransferase [Corynebacterium pseudodiphtheriticum]
MSDALFSIERNHTGRHSEMLEKAIKSARVAGVIEEIDEAMLSIARANALALDAAEKSDKPYYPIAQLTGPYREVLEVLRMTPATRESEANDELNQALAELSRPAVRG